MSTQQRKTRQIMQYEPQDREPAGGPKRSFPAWRLVAAGAGVAVALAAVPVIAPTLAQSLSATAPHAYWYISSERVRSLRAAVAIDAGGTGHNKQTWPLLAGDAWKL